MLMVGLGSTNVDQCSVEQPELAHSSKVQAIVVTIHARTHKWSSQQSMQELARLGGTETV